MSVDWVGNTKSAYTCNGASNHSELLRAENDFYATDPNAVEMLLELENFNKIIWEPACGLGHISEVLKRHNHIVYSTDIVKRGYEDFVIDFFEFNYKWNADIITNPPYKYAKEFVEKAMDVVENGCKVAMFLKLTFLESQKRRELFEKYPPKVIYVSSKRLQCARNGEFEKFKNGTGTAIAYAWYVWEKGYKGDSIVRWFN